MLFRSLLVLLTLLVLGVVVYVFYPLFIPLNSPTTCGGIANISCPSGYACRLSGNYPDASGRCFAKFMSRLPRFPWFKSGSIFSCPNKPWVDCLPRPGSANPQCQPEYLKWAKTNCPNFQGAAY